MNNTAKNPPKNAQTNTLKVIIDKKEYQVKSYYPSDISERIHKLAIGQAMREMGL